MKPGAPMQECEKIKNGLINNGFQINEIVGVNMTSWALSEIPVL